VTQDNPPTGEDGFWGRPDDPNQADATSPAEPEPTPPLPQPTQPLPPASGQPSQPWGSYPPPDAFPPAGYPPAGAWPQPGATWPDQGPGYPPQQPGYPPQQPGYPATAYATTPSAKPRRAGLVILLGVLGLCVLLVVGGLLLNPRTTTTSPPVNPTSPATGGGKATSTATTAATTSAASASDAVKGYLDALAAGDSTTALGYAAEPQNETLLTDEVLAAGNAIAPITDIAVEPSTGSGTSEVQVHYAIGPNEVDASFGVVETPSGWKLTEVAAQVALEQFPAVATINGTSLVAGNTITLFPGSYRTGSEDARYQVSSGTFFVDSPSDTVSLKVTAKLSSAGVAAVRSAAQKRLNACIKENKLHPSEGCGFWIRAEDQNGKKFTPKKVRWRITSGASTLKNVKLAVNQNDTAVVTGKTKVKLYLRVDATNGRWYWANVTIASLRAIVGDGSIEVRFNE
jgi:hypothetical protein